MVEVVDMTKSKHHWYTPILLFAIAAFLFFWGTRVVIDGEFWFGNGVGILDGTHTLVRPDTHPLKFWGCVTSSFGFGLFVVWQAIRELLGYLRQRKRVPPYLER